MIFKRKSSSIFSSIYFLMFLLSGFSACGTGNYSNLRPADNLEKGQFELQGGLGVGGGDLLPLGQVTYGLLDRIELNAYSDVKTTLFGTRLGILTSKENSFALTIGLRLGWTQDISKRNPARPFLDYLYDTSSVWAPEIVLGNRFEMKNSQMLEPYFAYRAFFTFPTYQVGAMKLGARYSGEASSRSDWFVNLEGGLTHQLSQPRDAGTHKSQFEVSAGMGVLLR